MFRIRSPSGFNSSAIARRNRGVKKAPFVVLIGANMPSVLSEISFISNPNDERLLRKTDQRQRIADGLYHGIASYLDSLNSLSYNKQKLVSDNHVGCGSASGARAGTPSRLPASNGDGNYTSFKFRSSRL